MSITMQGSLFGDRPVVSGDLRDKVRYILSTHPEARDDYRLTMYYFWMELEGLDRVLGDRAEAFKRWFTQHATAPKTIQNRTMEVQSWRPELEASPQVEEQRQRMAKQGPVL